MQFWKQYLNIIRNTPIRQQRHLWPTRDFNVFSGNNGQKGANSEHHVSRGPLQAWIHHTLSKLSDGRQTWGQYAMVLISWEREALKTQSIPCRY